MSINDIGRKIKSSWQGIVIPSIKNVRNCLDIKDDLFIIISIILIGLAGFGLGKLSALEKNRGEVIIKKANYSFIEDLVETEVRDFKNVPLSAAAMVVGEDARGMLVASENGTKYHFPWCAGASQIAEKNKIWFDSYEKAQTSGYTPASNCKGLK